jgi:hypothetical protein
MSKSGFENPSGFRCISIWNYNQICAEESFNAKQLLFREDCLLHGFDAGLREVIYMLDAIFAVTLFVGFGLIICFAGWCDKQVRYR